ncbi:sugar porter family MFS transporter [Marinimicrobium sp. ABcell2]|uniref:sugar porter family MFS transporter n=1 Tax=Marinimicrobium sp. ABcell2 TaxID=3069751 RepID=UPI0027AE2594|nr:sugar porter family MFS transporter [Marinimicrobium sp. ABcell2]MDQ2076345.1 sugar porter family MFS transporter [Marinimicrobium sp. ABcell2]
MTNPKILFWAITVALGGFLFGFDTAVISGAEQAIQREWGLSNALVGQMVAMALYGTVIGALFGGIPCDRYGRKTTLIGIAILYLVSAVGSALAPDAIWLMVFRFIGGLAVGASSVAAPVYISEIAPTHLRGRLTAIFQFNIVLGILIAYVSNYLIGSADFGNWRLMLGIEAVPAAIFVALVFLVPRSPRWLVVQRGAIEEARAVLQRINPATADAELAAIQHSHRTASGRSEWREFISGRFNLPILLAFLFAFFNQLSGINAVIYYAPRIFAMAGMEEGAALLSSAGLGMVNLTFTIIGLFLIDHFGRRFLMYIGSVGYIVSLACLALIFQAEAFDGALVPMLIFVFIASHAIGQGACIWVFISEIFPNNVRGFGMSFGSGTHWVFAAVIAGTFPYFAGLLGGAPIFAFFAVMMVLQLLFVRYMMPETKGVSLEELEAKLSRP